MRKSKKALLAGFGLQDRLIGLARPGVEAILLAAVALGCAQAGWGLLTPGSAGAANSTTSDEAEPLRIVARDVRSPFAPEAAGVEANSHAAAALVSSIQLVGVRVSDEHARSGAMFSLGDGAQRAFVIGQEISSGVRLADVQADYVIVSYDGGQRQLDMAAPPAFSFARALLGHADALAAVQASATPAPQAAPATPFAQAGVTEQDTAWFAMMLGSVENGENGLSGWRVTAPLPAAARAAGLREGDLIVSVNGVGPGDPAAVLQAAGQGSVELAVRRGRGENHTITVATDGST